MSGFIADSTQKGCKYWRPSFTGVVACGFHLQVSFLHSPWYVLRYSGYQLSTGSPDVQTLFGLPLPAAHFQLGPMVLRSALLTLTGPGWTLRVYPTRDQALPAVATGQSQVRSVRRHLS